MTTSTSSSGLLEPSWPPSSGTLHAPLRRADRLLSDAEIADRAAAEIAVPRVEAADSFVLHAPLELLARTALLPLVAPWAREAARRCIVRLGEQYAATGRALDEPAPRPFRSTADGVAALLAAIGTGELDDADAAAAWLAEALTAEELAGALADDVVPRLGAAAHGPIFLHQLVRVAPRSAAFARSLRGLVRELAREHEWRLGWHGELEREPRGAEASGSGRFAPRALASDRRAGDARSSAPRSADAIEAERAAADLVERLRRPTSPGDPGSHFIIPMMSLVERSGLAAEVLAAPTRALDPARASRVLARVAAWSMLQDEPGHAPYGWTHCLTMPQAVLGLAAYGRDPRASVAVAATHVLGFRATLGRVRLDPGWRPVRPPRPDALEALEASPPEAAASAWHAPREDVPRLVAALATRAALHHDAHLVKYTLACFDAARTDPGEASLYLAAAAYLSAWWREQDERGVLPEI